MKKSPQPPLEKGEKKIDDGKKGEEKLMMEKAQISGLSADDVLPKTVLLR